MPPTVELFTFTGSNACRSAELLLDHAGIDWRRRSLKPGLHPIVLKLRRFPRPTAPAAIIDGTKVQGSRRIARAIAEAMPEIGLLPSDAKAREVVLDAERDGEQLQNTARRVMYVLAQQDSSIVRPLIDANFPALPGPARSAIAAALVRAASHAHRARAERIDDYVEKIASVLDRLDELVLDGVLAADRPTVADFQVSPNLAALAGVDGIGEAIRARPCWRIAQRIEPTYPVEFSMTAPGGWIERLTP